MPPLQPEPQQHARQAQYVLRELAPHLAAMLQQQEVEVSGGVCVCACVWWVCSGVG